MQKSGFFLFGEKSRRSNGSLNDFVSFLDMGESSTEEERKKEREKNFFVRKSWQQGSKRDSDSFLPLKQRTAIEIGE